MTLVIEPEFPPLTIDTDGVARVAGSRVRLDTIVGAYQLGATPESIAQRYPSVSVGDVYAILAYYIKHRAEIDAYIQNREQESERIRREFEAEFPLVATTERKLIAKS